MEEEVDVRLVEIISSMLSIASCCSLSLSFFHSRCALAMFSLGSCVMLWYSFQNSWNFSLTAFFFCFPASGSPTHLSYSTTRMCRDVLLGWGMISMIPGWQVRA